MATAFANEAERAVSIDWRRALIANARTKLDDARRVSLAGGDAARQENASTDNTKGALIDQLAARLDELERKLGGGSMRDDAEHGSAAAADASVKTK